MLNGVKHVSCRDTYSDASCRTVLACYAFSKEDIEWLAGDGPRPMHGWSKSAEAGRTKVVALQGMERVLLDTETTGYDKGGEQDEDEDELEDTEQ